MIGNGQRITVSAIAELELASRASSTQASVTMPSEASEGCPRQQQDSQSTIFQTAPRRLAFVMLLRS